MKLLYQVVLPLLLLLQGGCALSPQTVSISPSIDMRDAGSMGNGRSVALDVADNRGTAVVGTRGGVYSRTSEIKTGGDIKTPIRNELSSGLQAMGYRVVSAGEPADASLTLVVEKIEYNATGEYKVSSVETAATVRIISKVDNREYSGRYRGKRTTDVLTAPDTAKNEEMINAALSHVLERVLTDSELHAFMNG